jgi:two-component system response regulator YesN
MRFFTCTLVLLLTASAWLAEPIAISGSAAGKPVFSRGSCPRRGSGSGIAKARQRILAADDDPTLQDVLAFFLGQEYEVRPATTGADALARVCHAPVDLVILDHRLPDSTGLDVLTELKSIRPSLPVVMLTGYGSEWICAAAFKLGVADYLQKPVNALDLVGVVHRILPPGPESGDSLRGSPMLRGLRAPLCTPIQKAMGLIQQRYWDKFSLSELARQVGMSKYRLSHRFREVLGVTFRDYLLRVRLERAKVLLTADEVSISEVAQMVGFGDLPRLDKVFKRYTGLTPSAYRSMARTSATSNQDLARNY